MIEVMWSFPCGAHRQPSLLWASATAVAQASSFLRQRLREERHVGYLGAVVSSERPRSVAKRLSLGRFGDQPHPFPAILRGLIVAVGA